MERFWKRANRQAIARSTASAKQARIAIFALTCDETVILLKNMLSTFL